MDGQKDGRMDGWILNSFQSISVVSGRWTGDNARLHGLKPCLPLERFLHPAGLKLGTA